MKEWQEVLSITSLVLICMICGFFIGYGSTKDYYRKNSILTETIMVQENHYFIEGQEKECRNVHTELCFSDNDGHMYWVPHPTKEQLAKLAKMSNYEFVIVNNYCNKDDINLIERKVMVGNKYKVEIPTPNGPNEN